MGWAYLVAAGLFECVWAVGLKYSNGFTRLAPSLFTIGAMVVSFKLLSLALRTIPLGTAYAVWTGIGAVGVAVVGMLAFDESRNALRVVSIGFIVLGLAGLRLFDGQTA